MRNRPETATVEFVAPPMQSACAACIAYEHNLCEAAAAAQWASAGLEPVRILQFAHTARARQVVCRDQDLYDAVPVICYGWAATIAILPNGSRQILSFLLPGDLVSTALLFDPRPPALVEAISDVTYRTLNRTQLETLLLRYPGLFEKVCKTWVEEKVRSDELIINLGRRTADERVARLILALAERLRNLGMTRDDPMTMEFLLRHHHIADATGLTPVHVSKVLSDFRRAGLVDIRDRLLTILDPAALRRVAQSS